MASASSDGEILIDLRELLQGDEGKRSLKKEKAKNSFEVQLQDPTQIIEGIHFSDEYIGIKRVYFCFYFFFNGCGCLLFPFKKKRNHNFFFLFFFFEN